MEELDKIISEQVETNYAGFWKRFAALTIDNVIVIFFTVYTIKSVLRDNLNFQKMISGDGDFSMYRSGSNEEEIYMFLVYTIQVLIFRWCYFAGMESSPFKATVGKLVVGIYVTDMNNKRISFGRATGRFFGKFLSGLIIYIGYIMAGFTEKKQALHDQMSMCLVLTK